MKCGLLGRKLGHSFSPMIHGLLADYSYTLFEKEPEQLEDFLRKGNWDGLNVTIPYKKTVLPYCDELSPLAQELGCVNALLRRKDGSIYGDNTDAVGFLYMARQVGIDYKDKKALVLGSGGASATAQVMLKRLGCSVTVISRTGEDNYENIARHDDAQVLVNTTPVGMYPETGVSPVDLSKLPKLETVLDVIYNPARTKLLLEAEKRGIACAGGLGMLAAQAVGAYALWTGNTPAAETVAQVQRAVQSRTENIVLIGMPGCGKTTLGQRLAAQMGRTFADADEVLTGKIGDIPNFLSTYGEEAFRTKETAVLAELGKQSGLVIATGGGCVTRRSNHDLLRQNGKIIWIRRDLEALPTDGRPLSQQMGTAALYEARKPLYEAFADVTVDNDSSVEEIAQKLLQGVNP